MAKLGFEPRVVWLQKSHALASFLELPLQKPLGVVVPVPQEWVFLGQEPLLGSWASHTYHQVSQDWPTLRRQSKAVFSKL